MAGFSGWIALAAVVAGLRFAVLGAWPGEDGGCWWAISIATRPR
jgi:hypothetical protein